jgi:signal transduction histidine kinase
MSGPVTALQAPPVDLLAQREGFLGTSVASAMLEAMPGPALVVNTERQILAVNHQLASMLRLEDMLALLGVRPGDALHCSVALTAAGGCGTGEACANCGALRAVREVLATRGRATHECRLTTGEPGDTRALELRVHASYLVIDGEEYVVLALEDLVSDKRRRVLERAFFHDILNTCGGVQGLAELLVELDGEPELEIEYKRDLVQLSRMVVEEIQAHRQMLAAEKGELAAARVDTDLPELLRDLVALYRHHVVSGDRQVGLAEMPSCRLCTDPLLLRRVVGNLVKNALEATPVRGVVSLGVELAADMVTISVHNAGVIPEAIQAQIFQRSFSTKGGEGRGIGTYAVKLFTERYLGGHVSFVSSQAVGTIFQVSLPAGTAISA